MAIKWSLHNPGRNPTSQHANAVEVSRNYSRWSGLSATFMIGMEGLGFDFAPEKSASRESCWFGDTHCLAVASKVQHLHKSLVACRNGYDSPHAEAVSRQIRYSFVH